MLDEKKEVEMNKENMSIDSMPDWFETLIIQIAKSLGITAEAFIQTMQPYWYHAEDTNEVVRNRMKVKLLNGTEFKVYAEKQGYKKHIELYEKLEEMGLRIRRVANKVYYDFDNNRVVNKVYYDFDDMAQDFNSSSSTGFGLFIEKYGVRARDLLNISPYEEFHTVSILDINALLKAEAEYYFRLLGCQSKLDIMSYDTAGKLELIERDFKHLSKCSSLSSIGMVQEKQYRRLQGCSSTTKWAQLKIFEGDEKLYADDAPRFAIDDDGEIHPVINLKSHEGLFVFMPTPLSVYM
jgi:hypothetical protein